MLFVLINKRTAESSVNPISDIPNSAGSGVYKFATHKNTV